MKLRGQLLLLSLLTLVLPWAGCQYVREMESVLRSAQEQSVAASAATLTGTLHGRADLLYRDPTLLEAQRAAEPQIYAHRLRAPVLVDGYAADWGAGRALRRIDASDEEAIGFLAGIHGRYLYLFISATDENVVYDTASELGDAVLVRTTTPAQMPKSYVFSTLAPGPVTPRETQFQDPWTLRGREEPRIRGDWQQTGRGYNLELRFPMDLVGLRLDFAVRDTGNNGRAEVRISSPAGSSLPPLPALLIYPSAPLEAALAAHARTDVRMRVTDQAGWLLGETGALSIGVPEFPEDEPKLMQGIQDRLYRSILEVPDEPYPADVQATGKIAGSHVDEALRGATASVWYRLPDDDRAVVSVAQPVLHDGRVIGAVVVEQTSDSILTLTNRALSRLLNFTLLAMVVAAFGLFGFATLLSFRIGRLRNAAEHALSPKGQIETRFPGQDASDELGDLARSFSRLMGRLREYNRYLQTLGSKLSHELRTPLTVVKSSLENLEEEDIPARGQTYTERAKQGVERLTAILGSMSEATRVEQSIQSTERERFDLGELVRRAGAAYADAYRGHRIEIDVAAGSHAFEGVPDLILQALDKLIDNAVDFTPQGGGIRVSLDDTGSEYRIAVANEGPALPREMENQLFDSLVSIRQKDEGSHHLGLGLYIVRLIAEHHGGSVAGRNMDNGRGVAFEIRLPAGGA